MTKQPIYRTVDGKRWTRLNWGWDKSEMISIRDEDKATIREKHPKAIFKIEPYHEPGFGDTKWELLVRLNG
jgi:hypothetical protein